MGANQIQYRCINQQTVSLPPWPCATVPPLSTPLALTAVTTQPFQCAGWTSGFGCESRTDRCSEKYYDSQYEYRHVVLPPEVAQHLPKGRLLSEPEWRALGVQQSRG